jgi:hypothetical protein
MLNHLAVLKGVTVASERKEMVDALLQQTMEELEVLLPLPLFRNEFIDTRMPGFEQNRRKGLGRKGCDHPDQGTTFERPNRHLVTPCGSIRYP